MQIVLNPAEYKQFWKMRRKNGLQK